MPDLADLFVPLPEDLLVNLAEAREAVDALLDDLAAMHGPPEGRPVTRFSQEPTARFVVLVARTVAKPSPIEASEHHFSRFQGVGKSTFSSLFSKSPLRHQK